LYSAPECGPCGAARSLLSSRGIPFSERSVTTSEDIAALKRLSGEAALPFLTIGAQRIKGYSDVEWTQYLDAAGYPKTSVLPTGYRQAAATPLVAVDKPAPAKAETKPDAQPEPAVPMAPAPAPANPAGIQF
jgi:glutaredoxin